MSLLDKLYRKGIKLEELTDIFAIRIVVIDEEQCYKALKVVHDLYVHGNDKFKNYVLNPKPNGYQSLHTIITTEDNYKIEIQISFILYCFEVEKRNFVNQHFEILLFVLKGNVA
ncbi:hypothetical protein A1C_04920 [Rickettsia akari str. Hartford]|uniref:RelA/SpoT domain-containing protein n=2 Tax=Rickettsia akari TaxID=786 RepID=A8GPB5_RICAH|nr:hypothetical protein A1C_04920 [Rickettsia akari str. Hartford]